MAITSEEAIEAYCEFRPFELPLGHRHVAHPVGGSPLWSVVTLDEGGRGYLGSFNLVGPDKQVWTFSSNPSIHDPDLVKSILARMYSAGVAALVEPDLLASKIRELTDAREESIRGLVRSAHAGELQTRPSRTLP